MAAFRRACSKLGWTDGRNVGSTTAGPGNARSHRESQRVGRARAGRHHCHERRSRAIARATRTVPIVFAVVADPVGAGFVESLARPGATSLALPSEYGVSGKWIELLKEIAPA